MSPHASHSAVDAGWQRSREKALHPGAGFAPCKRVLIGKNTSIRYEGDPPRARWAGGAPPAAGPQAPKLVSPTLNGNTYEKQAKKHPQRLAPLGVYLAYSFQGILMVLLIVALMETIRENRGPVEVCEPLQGH